MVCAETGCTASAKPAAREVTMKLRRVTSSGKSPIRSSCIFSVFLSEMGSPNSSASRRLLEDPPRVFRRGRRRAEPSAGAKGGQEKVLSQDRLLRVPLVARILLPAARRRRSPAHLL